MGDNNSFPLYHTLFRYTKSVSEIPHVVCNQLHEYLWAHHAPSVELCHQSHTIETSIEILINSSHYFPMKIFTSSFTFQKSIRRAFKNMCSERKKYVSIYRKFN